MFPSVEGGGLKAVTERKAKMGFVPLEPSYGAPSPAFVLRGASPCPGLSWRRMGQDMVGSVCVCGGGIEK